MNTHLKTFIKYPKGTNAIFTYLLSWTCIYDRNTKSDVIKRKRLNKNKTSQVKPKFLLIFYRLSISRYQMCFLIFFVVDSVVFVGGAGDMTNQSDKNKQNKIHLSLSQQAD